MIWYKFHNLFLFSRLEQRRVEVNEKRGDGAELADKLALADQRRREMEVGFLFAFFHGNIIWRNILLGILWGRIILHTLRKCFWHSLRKYFWNFVRNGFGIFCGNNFFGLFQEFLAFFEEMIFSILWRKSLFAFVIRNAQADRIRRLTEVSGHERIVRVR